MFGLVNLQVIYLKIPSYLHFKVLGGIITLLYMVPVWYGVGHQGGALTVLTSGLYLLHTVRNPSKAFLKALKKPGKL